MLDILARTVYTDFQEFIFSNNVLVAAAGFSIGAATKDMIMKILEALLPLFAYIVHNPATHAVYARIAHHISRSWLNRIVVAVTAASWMAFEYLMLVFLTFFVLEYVINRHVIGLRSTVKDKDQSDFIKAKDISPTIVDNLLA